MNVVLSKETTPKEMMHAHEHIDFLKKNISRQISKQL